MSTAPACPVRGVCRHPALCAHCVLELATPLILRPMSDWRADPTPYPLRKDAKPRAGLPAAFQGVKA